MVNERCFRAVRMCYTCLTQNLRKQDLKEKEKINLYWVNPSKRGGMDGVFRGLAVLLRGKSRGAARSARALCMSRL